MGWTDSAYHAVYNKLTFSGLSIYYSYEIKELII